MADDIEKGMNEMMKLYDEIRGKVTPSTERRRKIDACEAVTKDIVKIILERVTEIGGEFNEEHERCRLHQLLAHDYALSIYGAVASHSRAGQHCETLSIAAKRAEAAAELAAKEAQYKIMQEEIKQKEKIRLMEGQHKKGLEMQRSQLERLQAERDVEVARARLEIYDREIKQENVYQPTQPNNRPFTFSTLIDRQHPHIDMSVPPTDVSYLAKAIQESIATNRLPMPTPTMFSGEPMHFIEWRASSQCLIDQKNISSADKLYYLKKYVSGAAQKCLEGTFYRKDEDAYRDA